MTHIQAKREEEEEAEHSAISAQLMEAKKRATSAEAECLSPSEKGTASTGRCRGMPGKEGFSSGTFSMTWSLTPGKGGGSYNAMRLPTAI